MAKRITISIPDELFEEMQRVKNEFYLDLNTSQICQKALSEAVKEKSAHMIYEDTGIQDGLECFSKLTRKTSEKIAYALNGDNPKFKGKTLYEIVDTLENRNFGDDREFFTPQFIDLFEGDLVLHDWLKYDGGLELADKRSEAAWSYIEGWYQGVKQAFFDKQEDSK